MPLCNVCKESKAIMEFYASNRATCKRCVRLKSALYYAENFEHCRQTGQAWVEKNRERSCEIKLKWSRANAEYYRQYQRENAEVHAAATKRYAQANPEVYAAAQAKRRALRLQATPSWADETQIKAIYAEARRLTDLTGVVHEVDHEVPLQGLTVCGLHVQNNLRVVTRDVNRQKCNKFEETAK